ncbi:uncharacterized protein RJT21DRAFT_118165 [Scheffersomyces amazonensis]|uniref:uncharacterized protein n=1 Tax=Scheffersomyces amazonensis TaxID=1078765 RepID=UPI00315CD307
MYKGSLRGLNYIRGSKRLFTTNSVPPPPKRDFSTLIYGLTAITLASYGAYKFGQYQIINSPPSNLFPLNSVTKLSDLESPKYGTTEEMLQAIEEIRQKVPNAEVTNKEVDLDHHTKNDFTPHLPLDHEKPQFIIYPYTTEQVSEILKILNKYNIPIVPFSGGTSLEGHFFSTRQGVILDTSRMKQILEVHEDDLDCVVQAGVNWQELNKHLESRGLMFGADCGHGGLISGMINTNASGINASRYGAMNTNVISITVVLSDGTIVKTKQRPRKSSAGYNLTQLFIGSEGTLGIVTEATVKLHVIPKYETVVICQFPTILDSTNTVAQIFKSGIQPNAIEFLDADMMRCLKYSGYCDNSWQEKPTIFFKIGGLNKVVVDEYIKQLKSIAKVNKVELFKFAKNKQEGEELFSARKNAFYAMIDYGRNEIDEDMRIWVTDIAVPLSRLSPVLTEINQLIKSSGFESIILAHAGDGNFHADLYYKPEDKAKCEAVIKQMIKIGLDNEGTCTGEHGVGNAKRNYLAIELGDDAISLMRKLKMALDPKRILNPDKIFKIDPEDEGKY